MAIKKLIIDWEAEAFDYEGMSYQEAAACSRDLQIYMRGGALTPERENQLQQMLSKEGFDDGVSEGVNV